MAPIALYRTRWCAGARGATYTVDIVHRRASEGECKLRHQLSEALSSTLDDSGESLCRHKVAMMSEKLD